MAPKVFRAMSHAVLQVQLRGVKTWYLKPPPECWSACHGVMQVLVPVADKCSSN